MEIIRTRAVERSVRALGLTDAELRSLEDVIIAKPESGAVIKGLKGVRKIRFA